MRNAVAAVRLGTLFTIFAIAIGIGGCMTADIDRLSQHSLASPPMTTTTSLVSQPGLYAIKWVKDKESNGVIEGTERLLTIGDQVGFKTDDDGKLYAIAGDETFAMTSSLPPGTRRVVWYTKTEEPSEFAKGAGRFAKGTGEVALVAGAGLGVLLLGAEAESVVRHNTGNDYERRAERAAKKAGKPYPQ